MSRIISFEDACELPRVWDDMDIKNDPIYREASENGLSDLLLDDSSGPVGINILYRLDDMGDKVLGLYICPRKRGIDVWEALDYNGTIHSGKNIVNDIAEGSSLSDIVSKAKAVMNVCPVCGKSVPYKDQQRYSFAGRCCPECLPKMREKYEQPGWYN